MGYSCEKRRFSGKWILAKEEHLEQLEVFPIMELEPGAWIWPEPYVREHMRREFFLNQAVREAKMEFWCDNIIDIYINGEMVCCGKNYTGVCKVGRLLKEGKNIIAVRAYQTNSPLRFTAAMRGSIHIVLGDASGCCIKTDKEWHAYEVSDFHSSHEPEGWTTMENPGRKGREERKVICTRIHPRLLRRSCYFKKVVSISSSLMSAKMYATARGAYELFINGIKADESVLAPGSMEKYREYQVIDVLPLLNKGKNIITFLSGNGWYNCSSWGELRADRPAILGEMELIYKNGERTLLETDETWSVAASPLVDNDIQFGERYDARKEIPDWCEAEECREAFWQSADTCAVSYEKESFVCQNYPSIRKKQGKKPIMSIPLNRNNTLFDFGVNAAGRCRIVLKNCTRGELIKLQYCERLNEDGTPCIGPYVDVFFPYDSFPDGKAPYCRRNIDVYICKGKEHEVYEPRFSYTGFRYIYVEKGQAEIEEMEMLPMNTDLEENGEVITEYPLIRALWERITRSYRSNIFSGPTDCPTREKNFWNGDIQVFAHTACWYMDNSKFLARWTDGGRKLENDVYGYEDEEYILPLVLYQFYGDKEIVETKYPIAKKLLEERQSKMKGTLPLGMRSPYRDQLAVDNGMSSDFYSCCYYCFSLKSLSKMAAIVGKDAEAKCYVDQYHKAQEELLKRYYCDNNGDFGQKCQGGQVLPLALGLVPDIECRKVMDRLLFYVQKADNHLSTGFMATEHLLRLLCDYGHTDIAWKIFTQKGYPSWQYMIDTGATTITEDWCGNKSDNPWLSMNHFALGNVGRWFFEYLGGIRVDESEPGFKTVVCKPVFVREIGKLQIRYRSIQGKIESLWQFAGNTIFWKLTIPRSIDAIVFLPNGKHVCREAGEYEFQIEARTDNKQII